MDESDKQCTEDCCWHLTGTMLTSDPPLYEEICCHCGTTRTIRENRIPHLMKHGKFHPDKIVFNKNFMNVRK